MFRAKKRAAINLALEDVLSGPDFFDDNADMAARRADLKALTQQEAWEPIKNQKSLPPVRTAPPGNRARLVLKILGNGLLVPFFPRVGARVTVQAEHRGHIGFCWGVSEMTILSDDETKSYTVRHSKRAALQEGMRFIRLCAAFWRAYPALATQYQDRYNTLTSEAYWRTKLGMQSAASKGTDT